MIFPLGEGNLKYHCSQFNKFDIKSLISFELTTRFSISNATIEIIPFNSCWYKKRVSEINANVKIYDEGDDDYVVNDKSFVVYLNCKIVLELLLEVFQHKHKQDSSLSWQWILTPL